MCLNITKRHGVLRGAFTRGVCRSFRLPFTSQGEEHPGAFHVEEEFSWPRCL